MMNSFQLLLQGLQTAMSPGGLLAALFGAILGVIVGGLPGIGPLAGIAMLLPITFKIDPTFSIIMLAALYYGNMYGGSFTGILMNIPGDSASIMTTIDGYQMSRMGKAGKALSASTISSFIGGTIGIIVLTFLGPALANYGLAFGPAELSWLLIFSLTSIGWILGDNPSIGLLSTALGVIFATVGVDKAVGQPRFTFGSDNLLSGISFLPLVIGIFGISQVIDMVINKSNYETGTIKKLKMKDTLLNKQDMIDITPASIRTGLLGSFIGVLPGAGATIASFLSYLMEKRINRNKENIGKGAIEGVAAPESANNAAAMGAFAPLLSLGIPGSGSTAILLGGFMMWGLRPGPLLFTENPRFCWGLIGSMYTGNIICLILALACVPLLAKIVKIPSSVMVPIISVICVIGTYSENNSLFDVGLMLVFGIFGYIINEAKIPAAPLLLAFVLTPMLEQYTRQAFDISNGSLSIFVGSKISIVLIFLIIMFSVTPAIVKRVKKTKKPAAA